MKIQVVKGKGQGKTTKSAFDNALADAGIADYNIIPLSSIIPPEAEIEKVNKFQGNPKDYGNRLYVVMASDTIIEGTTAVGIGWTQEKEDKRGLFVEFHCSNESDVKEMIYDGLNEMMDRRKKNYSNIHYETETIKCKGYYACALVAAIFKGEDW
tara:strand:- start:50 stop:514 length:465 start_codon:yes stop_codon:yes gene_type:complete